MAKNLQIVDENNNINATCKYEPLNMSEKDKPKVGFKTKIGNTPVSMKTVGPDRAPIQTFKAYLDDSGNEYQKEDLVAYDPESGEELVAFDMTTIFSIVKYEPEANYTDRYVVDKYYELFPSDNGKKKDHERDLAMSSNKVGMKKLYDYLVKEGVVAKAEFVATSGHYRAGAGYVRPITVDGGKWTLELGTFKEEKVFSHLNEPILQPVAQQQQTKKTANKLL